MSNYFKRLIARNQNRVSMIKPLMISRHAVEFMPDPGLYDPFTTIVEKEEPAGVKPVRQNAHKGVSGETGAESKVQAQPPETGATGIVQRKELSPSSSTGPKPIVDSNNGIISTFRPEGIDNSSVSQAFSEPRVGSVHKPIQEEMSEQVQESHEINSLQSDETENNQPADTTGNTAGRQEDFFESHSAFEENPPSAFKKITLQGESSPANRQEKPGSSNSRHQPERIFKESPVQSGEDDIFPPMKIPETGIEPVPELSDGRGQVIDQVNRQITALPETRNGTEQEASKHGKVPLAEHKAPIEERLVSAVSDSRPSRAERIVTSYHPDDSDFREFTTKPDEIISKDKGKEIPPDAVELDEEKTEPRLFNSGPSEIDSSEATLSRKDPTIGKTELMENTRLIDGDNLQTLMQSAHSADKRSGRTEIGTLDETLSVVSRYPESKREQPISLKPMKAAGERSHATAKNGTVKSYTPGNQPENAAELSWERDHIVGEDTSAFPQVSSVKSLETQEKYEFPSHPGRSEEIEKAFSSLEENYQKLERNRIEKKEMVTPRNKRNTQPDKNFPLLKQTDNELGEKPIRTDRPDSMKSPKADNALDTMEGRLSSPAAGSLFSTWDNKKNISRQQPTRRSSPGQLKQDSKETIKVNIGHVEIRAIHPPAVGPVPQVTGPKSNTLSLDDYLKKRNTGGV